MSSELNPGESYAGAVCAVCGEAKRPNSAFCQTDFLALTWWQRKPLLAGPADPAFAEAFLSALQHLRLYPVRARQYGAGGRGWSYRSDDELRAAGYRRCEQDLDGAVCKVPGCQQRILWYWTPQGTKIPVQYDTLQPHRVTCADAAYFSRRRSGRASARAPRKPCRA
jgi:hypothetical protein